MLVEIAIFDSYGAGFEFAKPKRLAQLKNDLSTYYPHNLPGHLPPGSYTDDTQMSIAITEHILENYPWTKESLAERFVATYKRDTRNGYSRKFQEILDTVKNGSQLLETIIPNSDRCGAAMRSCPIGVCPYEFEIIKRAKIQAKITHNTPEGITSSVAIALAAHYCLYNKGPKSGLIDFLRSQEPTAHLFENNNDLWPKAARVTSEAIPCVKAAISAVIRNNSLSDCLKECIDYTGDVDSVAAMAGGILSCSKEVIRDLPCHLYDKLENGKYGLEYLENKDAELLKLV